MDRPSRVWELVKQREKPAMAAGFLVWESD